MGVTKLELEPGEFVKWLTATKEQIPDLAGLVLPEDMCDLIMAAYSMDKLDGTVEFFAPDGTDGDEVEMRMLLSGIPTIFDKRVPMGRFLSVINGGNSRPPTNDSGYVLEYEL